MKNKKTPPWVIVFGFIVIIAFGTILYVAAKSIWHLVLNAESEINVAIIAGGFTILLSVITLIIGKYYEKKRDIEQSIRVQKLPVYEELITYFINYLIDSKDLDAQEKHDSLVKFLKKQTSKLILWGGPEVLLHWGYFKTAAGNLTEEEIKSGAILFQFEELLKVIRKDMGQSNANLEKGDVLRLFVNDIDKYIK